MLAWKLKAFQTYFEIEPSRDAAFTYPEESRTINELVFNLERFFTFVDRSRVIDRNLLLYIVSNIDKFVLAFIQKLRVIRGKELKLVYIHENHKSEVV